MVDRILDDASTSEGGLPLVAHVLEALWRVRLDDVMGHEAYDALGGVGGALAKSADTIIDGLTQSGKKRARKLLLRLVKIGRGAEDTRQTASRREVLEVAGGDEEAERVLARLSGGRDPDKPDASSEMLARLVVVSGRDDDPRVDLVHEALLRKWETLQGWLVEDRTRLLELSRLRTWVEAGNELTGDRLAQAQGLLEKYPDDIRPKELALIKRSAEAEREKRRSDEVVERTREERKRLGDIYDFRVRWQRKASPIFIVLALVGALSTAFLVRDPNALTVCYLFSGMSLLMGIVTLVECKRDQRVSIAIKKELQEFPRKQTDPLAESRSSEGHSE